MGDYLRSGAQYTKWDTTSENVDIDLTSPMATRLPPTSLPIGPYVPPVRRQRHSMTPQMYFAQTDWFIGLKGKVLAVLCIACIFSVGMLTGYSIRKTGGRQQHVITPTVHLHSVNDECPLPHDDYAVEKIYIKSLLEGVDKENIEHWLWSATRDYHHISGSDRGRKMALQIRDSWRSLALQNVRIETFRPLLSHPDPDRPNEVKLMKGPQMLHNATFTIPSDLSLDALPYAAFAPSAKLRGKPVYVNYGRQDDFNYLKSRGITLNKTIGIMRFGKSLRTSIKYAEENGMAAVLLYADPSDYPTLERDAVPWANVKRTPGDPTTPFTPAVDDMYRIPRPDTHLPQIPVQPISASDAEMFLRGIGGNLSPIEWRGAMNVSYKMGPGYDYAAEVEVHMAVYNMFQEMKIYNVIGVFPGTHERGRYVIVGCHHDSWARGAGDPGTGLAILMELARLFSELRKDDWSPRRTLILAAWDGGEMGQIGSTEWVQSHNVELSRRTVAYINLDQAVSGNYSLFVSATPLLRQALKMAASQVPCHETHHAPHMTLYDMWRLRRPYNASKSRAEPQMYAPSSGSDFTPFMQLLGVPVAHARFAGVDPDADYGRRHTAYDRFEAIANDTDVDFNATAALTRLVALLLLHLTDSMELPYQASDYARHVTRDFSQFERDYTDSFRTIGHKIDTLSKAVHQFVEAANNFQQHYEMTKRQKLLLPVLQEYNERLLQLEQCFLLPSSYPRHTHNRHILYGPDELGAPNRATIFPHIVAALRAANKRPAKNNVNFVHETVSLAMNALRQAAYTLDSFLLNATD